MPISGRAFNTLWKAARSSGVSLRGLRPGPGSLHGLYGILSAREEKATELNGKVVSLAHSTSEQQYHTASHRPTPSSISTGRGIFPHLPQGFSFTSTGIFENRQDLASFQGIVKSSSFALGDLFVPSKNVHSYAIESPAPVLRQLLITACGPDCPGLVSSLSKRILECGGNVEESRMTRLAGEFSVIMLVSVDGSTPRIPEELRQRLLELEGLHITTRWAREEPARPRKPSKKFRRIFLRGADNPGLVYNVTEYLAGNKINIENLETATEEAPFGGTTLFRMEGVIAMPVTTSTKDLRQNLDVLQRSLGVTIDVFDMDPLKKAEDMNRFWQQAQSVGGASKYSILAQRESEGLGKDKLI